MTLYARVRDAVGNTTESVEAMVTFDATAPQNAQVTRTMAAFFKQ